MGVAVCLLSLTIFKLFVGCVCDYTLLSCCDNVICNMIKRRRGLVVKCAVLIGAFWLGFAIYANTVARLYDDGRSVNRDAQRNGGTLTEHHTPTLQPHRWRNEPENDDTKRDRELQEQVRRDQVQLQQLLDGRTAPVVPLQTPDLQQYDPQTANLVRLGLIIPKWNITEEVPEHLGAPGTGKYIFLATGVAR